MHFNHINSRDKSKGWAKTDYAANAGDSAAGSFPDGPQTLACLTSFPNCDWVPISPPDDSGIVMQRSAIKDDEVTDGMSMTLLLAEKYLDPNFYTTGNDAADNQTLWCGLDSDTCRFTTDAIHRHAAAGRAVGPGRRPTVTVLEQHAASRQRPADLRAGDGAAAARVRIAPATVRSLRRRLAIRVDD